MSHLIQTIIIQLLIHITEILVKVVMVITMKENQLRWTHIKNTLKEKEFRVLKRRIKELFKIQDLIL
jgi:hypothetical protein